MLPANDFIKQLMIESKINCHHYKQVHGGDINEAYCLIGENEKYFLKLNDAERYPGMFVKEAEGLTALNKHSSFTIPKVIHTGITGHKQYLLLEWIEAGIPATNFWEEFGRTLAMMHQQPQSYFGWSADNYIGSLSQNNLRHNNWSSFYKECRIIPLIKQGFDEGIFDKKDIQSAEMLCNKLDNLFPDEPASLLHGDLWSGNFMVSSIGKSTLFDPAVYNGHREMDIGMTMLFGGFSPRFYDAYIEYRSLETQWQQRLQLTQLYPLLVHALLFNGNYISRCREIWEPFSQ